MLRSRQELCAVVSAADVFTRKVCEHIERAEGVPKDGVTAHLEHKDERGGVRVLVVLAVDKLVEG